jgi:MFS family permease
LSAGVSSWLLTILFFGTIIGSLAGGWLADHMGIVISFRWTVVPFILSVILYYWIYAQFNDKKFYS